MPPEQSPKFKIGDKARIPKENHDYLLRAHSHLKEIPRFLTITKLVTRTNDVEHWYESKELESIHIRESYLRRFCKLARKRKK